MSFLSKRKKTVAIASLVAVLLAVAVPIVWAYFDVPPGHWAEAGINKITNLHITSGCGGGNYCPDAYVTRAQMAVFMANLTQAWSNTNDPYIYRVDNQNDGTDYSGDGIVARSYDQTGLVGVSYGAGYADNGIYGETNSPSSFEAGVYAVSTDYATGLIARSTYGWGAYLQGEDSIAGMDLVLGSGASNDDGNLSSNPSETDSDLDFFSNDEVWIDLDQDNNSVASFSIYNGEDYQVFSVDESGNTWAGNNLTASGDLVVYGSKSSVAQTQEGAKRMYAVESPENWFEDFGSGQLVNGKAVIEIEPLFLDAVNAQVDYHIFLTPLGDCKGLFVTNKTPTSFEVQELQGGASGVQFDYRIVAKRLGYEDVRMEAVEAPTPDTEPEDTVHAGPVARPIHDAEEEK